VLERLEVGVPVKEVHRAHRSGQDMMHLPTWCFSCSSCHLEQGIEERPPPILAPTGSVPVSVPRPRFRSSSVTVSVPSFPFLFPASRWRARRAATSEPTVAAEPQTAADRAIVSEPARPRRSRFVTRIRDRPPRSERSRPRAM
jgi:hypothetical protein